MSDSSLHTVYVRECVQRWQSGDAEAADHLFRLINKRLENLARKMLRSYPNVHDFADTNDVLQGAVMRLLRTLRKIEPQSTRHFFNLAATHLRRELRDIARSVRDKPRPGSGPRIDEDSSIAPESPGNGPSDELDLWSRFHQAVEELSVEEREVFSLTFYNGWTQPQIAELMGINERTVRRRWRDACFQLTRLVGGNLPNVS